MEDEEKTKAVEKLMQELTIVSVTSGTMEKVAEANEPEVSVQRDLVPVVKQTLFYVQHAKIYPIFMPQPERPLQILIHVVRHAEVHSEFATNPLHCSD